MAILEMIPPEYWRRLKKELARLNLNGISEEALPSQHPVGRRTAIQYEEAMEAIFEERIAKRYKKRIERIANRYKRRIQELEWVAEKRKEKIDELDSLLGGEIQRREDATRKL